MPDFFTQVDRASARAIFTALGKPGTYLPADGSDGTDIVAIVGQEPVISGDAGQILEYRQVVSFRLEQVRTKPGDQVVFDDKLFILGNIIQGSDDATVRKHFAVHIVPHASFLITVDGDRILTADGDYLMAA